MTRDFDTTPGWIGFVGIDLVIGPTHNILKLGIWSMYVVNSPITLIMAF